MEGLGGVKKIFELVTASVFTLKRTFLTTILGVEIKALQKIRALNM